MTNNEISKEEFDSLVDKFFEISLITDDIQKDISSAIILNKKAGEKLVQQLKMSEEDMMRIMDGAVLSFLAGMPLATMNRCNLFMQAIAMHANITNNLLMHRIIDEINKRVLEAN